MYLVTGAAGFIGSAMVWELNQKGITNIVCVDDYEKDNRWKNLRDLQFIEFVPKDQLFDFLEVSQLADNLEAVFHMGACSSTTEEDMDFLLHNNYFYSQSLFDFCNQNKVKFIYASSAATYGNGENGFNDCTDSAALSPLNKYGYSKILFDRWIAKQQNQCNWVGLKFFNVYGPNEYHKTGMMSMIYQAYHQILETGKVKLFKSHREDYKDGEQKRDFVYVKDITRWMLEIAQLKELTGIFNMGHGQARTWIDLANATFKAMTKEPNIEFVDIPPNIREQYQYFTEAKMTKLLETGVSQPQWDLETGVNDYIQNYLSTKKPYL